MSDLKYVIISEKPYFGMNCPQTSRFFSSSSDSLNNFEYKHDLSFSANAHARRPTSRSKLECLLLLTVQRSLSSLPACSTLFLLKQTGKKWRHPALQAYATATAGSTHMCTETQIIRLARFPPAKPSSCVQAFSKSWTLQPQIRNK